MKFYERVKTLREKAGLSIKDFAAIFNVSERTVIKWESNLSYPNIGIFVKIADYFSVSGDYLAGRGDGE